MARVAARFREFNRLIGAFPVYQLVIMELALFLRVPSVSQSTGIQSIKLRLNNNKIQFNLHNSCLTWMILILLFINNAKRSKSATKFYFLFFIFLWFGVCAVHFSLRMLNAICIWCVVNLATQHLPFQLKTDTKQTQHNL